RSILETESATLAAARCASDDLDAIKAALDRMGGEERWEDGSIEADLLFHRTIARATGNGYIYTFISFVCEQIRQSIHYARLTNPLHDLVESRMPAHRSGRTRHVSPWNWKAPARSTGFTPNCRTRECRSSGRPATMSGTRAAPTSTTRMGHCGSSTPGPARDRATITIRKCDPIATASQEGPRGMQTVQQ
ncbi:MAG: FadR family transcriptional regulator, partial [Mesorhizobium sp.]